MEVERGEGMRGRARGHVLWGRRERGRVWAQVCGVASVVRIRAGGVLVLVADLAASPLNPEELGSQLAGGCSQNLQEVDE